MMESKTKKTLADRTEELFSRQSLMFDEMQLMRRCVILGCWFIGSNLAHNLMKTWFQRFLLVDFDTIGTENLLNQNYFSEDVGLSKRQALANHLIEFSPIDMDIDTDDNIENIISGKVELFDWDIIFLSPDNLSIRKKFLSWLIQKQKKGELTNVLLVVVGTNSDMILFHLIQHTTKGIEKLLELYSGDESNYSVGVCWNKSAYFMGSLVSGLVISYLKNYCLWQTTPLVIQKMWLNDQSILLDID